MPVRVGGLWWCAAYSVNMEEVWVIDSVAANPCEAHDLFLKEMVYAIMFCIKLMLKW